MKQSGLLFLFSDICFHVLKISGIVVWSRWPCSTWEKYHLHRSFSHDKYRL